MFYGIRAGTSIRFAFEDSNLRRSRAPSEQGRDGKQDSATAGPGLARHAPAMT